MNMSLNMLGAGNGATAFGLKAMEELKSLEEERRRSSHALARSPDIASNEMCTFLIINIISECVLQFLNFFPMETFCFPGTLPKK